MAGLNEPFFLQTFHYPDGKVLSGGKLYFYVAASTNTPKNVFYDYDLTLPVTQPLVLDSSGTAPEYFFEAGEYKIVIYDLNNVLIASRDHITGSGGGVGGGDDAFTVKAGPTDTAPATLIEKLESSQTIVFGEDIFGGVHKVYANVDTSNVLDGKVKADLNDPVPDYLDAKFEDGYYIDMTSNTTDHTIKFDFIGPAYVPKTGGSFTGAVTIPTLTTNTIETNYLLSNGGIDNVGAISTDSIVAGSGSINNLVAGTLRIANMAGAANQVLIVDASGNVQKADALYKVKVSDTDPTGGYLTTKLYAGAGIALNVSNDPTNGDNISISLVNIPTPLALPNTQVAVGTGTGVASYAGLTYTTNDLVCGYGELDSYFVSGQGPYAAFRNTGVSATNFRDAISQDGVGDVRVGASGAYGAIILRASDKLIRFNLLSTVEIWGPFIPQHVDVNTNTYVLPTMLPGQKFTLRFLNNTTGTTVTANSTQKVYYRATTGASTSVLASTQVDITHIFGLFAGCLVASATLVGVDTNTVQLVY